MALNATTASETVLEEYRLQSGIISRIELTEEFGARRTYVFDVVHPPPELKLRSE